MTASAWITAIYAVMSALTFLVYRHDKHAARNARPRTSEATLHLLELFGGWPGALVAQVLVRHKNAKVGYQIVFWLIVAIHGVGWAVAWR